MAEQSHAHGALDDAVWQWLPYSSCPVMAAVLPRYSMTAQAPDILINEHPRIELRGLHLYGVIRNDISSNHGWGDRYLFASPANPPQDAVRCSALWRGYTATFLLDENGCLTLLSYRYPLSLTKARTETINELLNGDFWLVLKPAFSAPRTYLPFIDGKIVENESQWIVEDP